MRNVALVLMLFTVNVHAAESAQQKNKRIVREFYEMAFVNNKPLDAAAKYLSEGYRQHNPYVEDGRKGFTDFFSKIKLAGKSEIKRLIAEDDLVVVHANGKRDPKDLGTAVVDIFRVKGDLIVEHWDVMQKVPADPKNSNTMF